MTNVYKRVEVNFACFKIEAAAPNLAIECYFTVNPKNS